jgi:hypothetical protein
MEQWTDLDRKTKTLEGSKFTPNADNVALLSQKLDDYRDKFSTLQRVLLDKKLQEDETPITETEFQAKLKERTKAVAQKAGRMTELPKDFALSFEEYTGTLPASPEVAAKLNVQLDVTEKLVNTLLEAGVKSIDSLERTRLPEERGGAPAARTAPAPAPAPAHGAAHGPAKPAVAFTSIPVVDRHPIKCVFTCDQGPLQNVMNNLANPAKTPQFLAVRQLHVENTKPEAPTKDDIKQLIKPPGSAATPPPRTTEKTVSTIRTVPVATPAEKDAAEIMGGESLKVYLEVDYLRFRKPEEVSATPAPKIPAPAAPKR